MVAISKLSRINRQPARAARPAAELPRHRRRAPDAPASNGGVGDFFRTHKKKMISGAMLGVSAIPMVATAAPATETPEAKFDAFSARAAALNENPDGLSHTELTKKRGALLREYIMDRGTVGLGAETDTDKDGLSLASEHLFGTNPLVADTDGDKMADGYEVAKGLDPASTQDASDIDVDSWSFNYIPMSKNPMIERDTMLYYDLLMKDRTGDDPGMRYVEGKSALDDGHYFLSSSLDEKNAELTAAKDFNGDGVLTPGVEKDFLSPGATETTFGADGKTDSKMSVGWWGHCNDVAIAGVTFSEPTEAVKFELAESFTRHTVSTKHGTFHAEKITAGETHTDIKLLSGQIVRLANEDISSTTTKEITELEFSPTMIKHLLSELVHRESTHDSDFVGNRFNGAPATVRLTDGTIVTGGLASSLHDRAEITGEAKIKATNFTKDVKIKVFEDGKYVTKTFAPEEIDSVFAENKRDTKPIEFHETVLKWLGSDAKPAVMDKDSGPHVWNYSFDEYELDQKENAEDSNTVDYTMKVKFAGGGMKSTYRYSITYEDGKPVKGTWADGSPNPDFLWRVRGDISGYDHTPGWFNDATPIDFDTVMELYSGSVKAE